MQPKPSSDTSNPEVPNCRVFILYVFCSKIAKEGRAFCIPITGFLTNITDWEGWYQKGTADIQLNLFYDYQNNVKSYPEWQEWLRKHQPEMQSYGVNMILLLLWQVQKGTDKGTGHGIRICQDQ